MQHFVFTPHSVYTAVQTILYTVWQNATHIQSTSAILKISAEFIVYNTAV